MKTPSHLYRQWPTSESAPIEITTHKGEPYTIVPGAWARSDILIGVDPKIRGRFGPPLKARTLPIDNPAELDGVAVIAPRLGSDLGRAVAADPIVSRWPVIVVGSAGQEELDEIERACPVPAAVSSATPAEVPARVRALLEVWPIIGLVPAGAPVRPGWVQAARMVVTSTGECPADDGPVLVAHVNAEAPRVRVGIVMVVGPRAVDASLGAISSLIARTNMADHHLAVVDATNNPDDAAQLRRYVTALATHVGGVTVVVNAASAGYATAANAGVEALFNDDVVRADRRVEAVCLVDADVRFTPGWLPCLLRAMSLAQADMVSPILSTGGRLTVHLAGHAGLSNAHRFAGGRSYLDVAAALRLLPPRYPAAAPPDRACVLVRASTWRHHDGLTSSTPGGHDAVMGLWARVQADGGRAVFADDAFVWHEGGVTVGDATRRLYGEAAEALATRDAAAGVRMRNAAEAWPATAARLVEAVRGTRPTGLPVHFLTVDVGPWGASIVLLRLVQELREWGIAATLGHFHERVYDVPLTYGTVRHEHEDTFTNRFPDAVGWSRGVVVATHWSTGRLINQAAAAHKGLVPMAFWQDAEHRFADGQGARAFPMDRAREYVAIPHRVYIAPWIWQEVAAEFGLEDNFLTAPIPVGIDTHTFRPARHALAEVRPRPFSVLAMWRPSTPRRGADRIRKVYELLRARHGADVQLQLYGWPDRAPSVVDVHHGRMTQRQVARVLRGADVFLEASDFQGFGLPGLEAMACGVPLVSTDTKGVWAYADRRSAVITERPAAGDDHDPVALADAIGQLMRDPDNREAIAAAGARRASGLAWRRVAAQWVIYLARLWGDRGTDPRYAEGLLTSARNARAFLDQTGGRGLS